jgi:KaiC/GvpD/RAD55 family RecA-like ATPase
LSRFLEAGAKADETTFYVTVETANAKALAEDYPSNFCLVLCNPQADFIIQNLPNIYKLKGVENLNEIDIALTKAFRALKPSTTNQKRICIDIISDVLLQHHPVNTRRWLSALLPTLKMKGFTILAVLNPQMHPPEEVQAILGLFDGEIRISEQTTPQGMQQTLRIQRMHDQKFSDTQLVLNKEKLK